MRNTTITLLLFTAIITISGKCKKDSGPPPDNPYGLPNATQEGRNIFACRVNGQNWISESGIHNMGGGITDTSFGVHGRKSISATSGEQYDFGIIGYFIQSNSTYSLNDTAHKFVRYFGVSVGCFAPNGGYSTVMIKGYIGEITFTKVDRINKILSGKFWFNIKTDYCDTMKVTEGRFDIKY
jgi:hypothetical protein